MIKYTKLSKVLTLLPKKLREEDSRSQLLSYALEGYRQLTHPLQTQNKVELIKLVDHKVQLPTDIKYLNMVFCMTNTSDNINIDLATTDTENTDVETVTTYTETDGTVVTITEREFTDRYLLNHRLYLHNTFYNNAYFNNFYPLKYLQGGNAYSDCCLNKHIDCIDTFTVDPDGVLWSNISEGWLCLDYDTEVMSDGEYLIVDNPIIMRYLSYWVQRLHLENRLYGKEQGVGQILNNIESKVNIWYTKANGIINMLGINRNLIGELTNVRYNAKLLTYLPENYRTKYEARY